MSLKKNAQLDTSNKGLPKLLAILFKMLEIVMTPNFLMFIWHVSCSVKRTLCVLSASSFSAVSVGWKLSSETTNLKKEMYMNVFRMRVL